MGMKVRAVVVPAWAFAAAFGWASPAWAHPGYPAVVDKSLGLTKTVETIFPTMGCQLCHNSPSGADQLKAFGSLLVSTYGLSSDMGSEHDPSLEQALIGLKASDSAAVEDLQHGVDPNGDPTVFAGALPTPQYGCSMGTSRVDEGLGRSWLAILPPLAVLLHRRRGDGRRRG
jgi:hypothetical protein